MFSEIKKFHPLTFVATALTVLFISFCFINNFVIRWWLMLPIALIAGFIFFGQIKKSKGLENRASFYGFIIIIGAFIFRDIMMAYKIASIINVFGERAITIHNFFK